MIKKQILILLIFLGIHCSNLSAEQNFPVSVSNVGINQVKIPGIQEKWGEFEIEIEGGKNPTPKATNVNYVDNIKLKLTCAYNIGSKKKKAFQFYNSEVDIVTLKNGQKNKVFFYLPPEIFKRDNVSIDPTAYLIELEVDGKPLKIQKTQVSSTLTDISRVESFKKRAQAEAKKNEGVMLPIYKTPFYNSKEFIKKLKELPAFIQKQN